MNNKIKKALPALLLVTTFGATSVIAAESNQHTIQLNTQQCMIGEITISSQSINNKEQSTNTVGTSNSLKSNIDTQTLFSKIDERISADIDSSMSKINSQIDKNLSQVTSSITAYVSSLLSN